MKKDLLILLLAVLFIAGWRGRERYSAPLTIELVYYAVDTASDDTYLAQIDHVNSYKTGMFVLLNPVTDNTGACTLNINSLGDKSLKTVLGQDPGDSHIDAAQIVPLCYDGTNFIVMTPDSNP